MIASYVCRYTIARRGWLSGTTSYNFLSVGQCEFSFNKIEMVLFVCLSVCLSVGQCEFSFNKIEMVLSVCLSVGQCEFSFNKIEMVLFSVCLSVGQCEFSFNKIEMVLFVCLSVCLSVGQCEFSFNKIEMVMEMNRREMLRYERVYRSEVKGQFARLGSCACHIGLVVILLIYVTLHHHE